MVPVVGDALLLKETANPTVLTSTNSEGMNTIQSLKV
jgi:hypothetical protein